TQSFGGLAQGERLAFGPESAARASGGRLVAATYLRGPHVVRAAEVMEVVRGGTFAQTLVFEVCSGHAGPDTLLKVVRAAGDGPWLRGFCREVQKALEHEGCGMNDT